MSQYLYLGTQNLTDRIYGEIKQAGGAWKVKQEGIYSLTVAAVKDAPEGTSISFSVAFDSADRASRFLAYCYQYSPDCPTFDEGAGANIDLYIRAKDWRYKVWGVVVRPAGLNKTPLDYILYTYDVTCYLYSPYSVARRAGAWLQASITSLPVTKSISNARGHLAGSFESLSITCKYAGSAHVKNLVHSIGSDALIMATEALTNEVWELLGNENKLLETYEDTITSGTQWGQDWTGDGAYDTGAMKLNDTESAYIRLSGPNPIRTPVVMTADLSLDSGGADGLAYVEISDDLVAWTTVLTQAEFVSGAVAYSLQGSEYMTDCYVRVRCASGTAGKYLRIGSVKFEVERWIEVGDVPQIEPGESATCTVDATTGSESIDIDGEFYERRMFV